MSDLVGNPEDRFSRVEAQIVDDSKSLCSYTVLHKKWTHSEPFGDQVNLKCHST